MKRLLLPFIALAVFAAALSGCGQKGPLYLPAPAAQAEQPVAPAASTPGKGTSTR